MKKLILTLALAFALLSPAPAVEFSTDTAAGKKLTICRVDLRKEQLHLFLRDPAGQPLKTFAQLDALLKEKGKKLVFAMNAGMYHADFSPVGLFVSAGKQLAPLNTADDDGNFFLKPNGVFVITDKGAQVVETSLYSKIEGRVLLATQSGPMLVHKGKLHPAFNAGSESRLYRNGVCAPTPHEVVFVNSEDPINFHEFATYFKDVLKCPEALFLDGTINSLHSTELKRSDARMDLGPIIGVIE